MRFRSYGGHRRREFETIGPLWAHGCSPGSYEAVAHASDSGGGPGVVAATGADRNVMKHSQLPARLRPMPGWPGGRALAARVRSFGCFRPGWLAAVQGP